MLTQKTRIVVKRAFKPEKSVKITNNDEQMHIILKHHTMIPSKYIYHFRGIFRVSRIMLIPKKLKTGGALACNAEPIFMQTYII